MIKCADDVTKLKVYGSSSRNCNTVPGEYTVLMYSPILPPRGGWSPGRRGVLRLPLLPHSSRLLSEGCASNGPARATSQAGSGAEGTREWQMRRGCAICKCQSSNLDVQPTSAMILFPKRSTIHQSRLRPERLEGVFLHLSTART